MDNALRVYPALGLYCLFANQSVTLNDSNLFSTDAAAQITGRVGFYNSNTGEFRKLFPFDFRGRDSGGSLPESYQMSDHRCILYDGSAYTLCKPVFYTTQKEAKPGEESDLERVVDRCTELYGKSNDCFVMSECERSNLSRSWFKTYIEGLDSTRKDGQVDCLLGETMSLTDRWAVMGLDCRRGDNVAIGGGVASLRFSLSMLYALNFIQRHYSVYVISSATAHSYAAYKSACANLGIELVDKPGEIALLLNQLAQTVDRGTDAQTQLLIVSEFEDLEESLQDWMDEVGKDANQPRPVSQNGGELTKVKRQSPAVPVDEAELAKLLNKRAQDKAKARVERPAAQTVSNLFQDLSKILEKGSRYGVHIVWSSERSPQSFLANRKLLGSSALNATVKGTFAYRFCTKTVERGLSREFGFDQEESPASLDSKREGSIVYCSDRTGNVSKLRPFSLSWESVL